MATIRKRTLPSGLVRWQVDYRDQRGTRRHRQFPTRRAADEWLVQARVEVASGTHTARSTSPTIREAGDAWLSHCTAEGLERSTIKQRKAHLTHHIKPFIGEIKLSDLTAPRVHQFVLDLRDAGRSLAMRRKVLTSVKCLLSHAQLSGSVAQNVARSIKLKADRRKEGDDDLIAGHTMPSKAELRAIIENAPARWKTFFIVAIFTGLRASELRGLRWDDVDLTSGATRVRQRADAWGHLGPPKSAAGRREIPLAPMAIAALREWQLACPRVIDPIKPILDENGRPTRTKLDLVFPNDVGRVAELTNIWKRIYAPLQTACGIVDDTGEKDEKGEPILRPRYGFHALRHAAASLFIEQGWTPKKIQTVLGHASIQMTFDLYGHLFKDPEADRQAVEKIQAALLKG